MERIARFLAELGVPDRVGFIGNIRLRIAELLVDKCSELGEEEFRELVNSLVEEVVNVASQVQDS